MKYNCFDLSVYQKILEKKCVMVFSKNNCFQHFLIIKSY